MVILNCIPESRGWSPIQHMIALAAELLDARTINVADHHPGIITEALAALRRRAIGRGREPCLLVGAGPADLRKILVVPNWRGRFGALGAWVIDSFWVDHIPKMFKWTNPFDFLFVTLKEDIDDWSRIAGAKALWLPWGTDALRLGSSSPDRAWDITRVGRQPPEWEDDATAAEAAERLVIKYRPRPTSDGLNTLQNQRMMMASVYATTKYVLAFSNSVNPEPYTHKKRQYLTGRWVDGLAGGSILAGISPRGETAETLLWQEATLDFGSIRREQGLQVLAAALSQWSPRLAAKNHLMSLKILDWRWRFQTLADAFGLSCPRLSDEIRALQERIRSLGG